MSAKTYPFTFDSTGYEVTIQKVPRTLVNDIRLMHLATKPEPPLGPPIELDGPMKGMREEIDDPNHPAVKKYYADLQDWLRMVNTDIMEKQLELGVIEILTDGWEGQAQERREWLTKIGVKDLPESDKVFWITRVAAGTEEDLEELAEAIKNRSVPDKEKIDAAVDSFRSPVQGQASKGNRNKA